MSNLSIARELSESSRELREAAYRDRDVMVRRELTLIEKKRRAFAAMSRAADARGMDAYRQYAQMHMRFVPLECGCVLDCLSYEKRWAHQCEGHRS